MTGYSALVIALLCIAAFPACQTVHAKEATSSLRQGQVFSESEAAERLKAMANAIPDAEAWKKHAAQIRANMLRGAKLERLPAPCNLNAIVHTRRELDGYNVENVAFEALPGFLVTGNLYTPSKPADSMPGILVAHGHLENGRRHESTQKLAASLARMGATVFAWDMLGFGESTLCEHKHPQALRIQTYTSMRALDFLLSRPGVDQRQLAITGASGGGTQSFLLAAVDDRIDVSAPVVQVSAHFFGGCNCESGMPIHVGDGLETNNVEIAASFAPKPQLLVSDGGDWTANTPDVEFPFIQRIYRLLGAESNVENAHFAAEGHDYGPSKRMAVYQFFARHLQLDAAKIQDEAGGFNESFVTVLGLTDLAALDGTHAPPPDVQDDCAEVVQLLDRTDAKR